MIKLAVIIIPLLFIQIGCANTKNSKLKDTMATSSYTPPTPPPIPEQIKKDPESYKTVDSGRAYSLTLKNADLRDVLILLSKESGVSIVAERGIRGIVQIEAKNKKLGELLYTILKPLGYTASIENGMILVGRPSLTTRTFRMNYLKDTRNSSSNTSVSGFAAGGSGSVSVSTKGTSDYWGAVESSLEMFVFGTSGKGKREGGGYIVGEEEKKITSDTKTNKPGKAENKNSPQDFDDPMLSNSQLNDNRLKQLVVNEMAGIIQITDFPENIDKIAAFLNDVEEGSKRQVLIQAHIMEVALNDSFSMGIDWKTIVYNLANFSISQAVIPTNSGATTVAGSNVFKFSATKGDKFGLMLDAMKEQGNVNMLSSPKITALNNQKAVIKLTTKEVSWVSSKTTSTNNNSSDTYTTTPQIDEVGIFLDVTPQIASDGSIIMQIHPSVSEIREMSTSPDKTSTKPIINVREIDTMVDAKAGETIVIAGLISDKLSETKRGVPLLQDIPYLGSLFSYRNQSRAKTELVIMMTPYFLNPKSIDDIRRDHEERMQNIGGNFHLINNMGSMITEKSSRDWIMRSEPNRGEATQKTENRIMETRSDASEPSTKSTKSTYIETKTTPIPEASVYSKPAEINMVEKPSIALVKPYSKEQSENIVAIPSTNQVQTVSTTTTTEQTLYRTAVTAYKIGDCKESIKAFDIFSRSYPYSPFLSDATYYRKDCVERMANADK